MLRRLRRRYLGDRPCRLLWLLYPTSLVLFVDLLTRPRELRELFRHELGLYAYGAFASVCIWAGLLWLFFRMLTLRRGALGRKARFGRVWLAAWLIPAFGLSLFGQVAYHRATGAYFTRETLVLAKELPETVRSWLRESGADVFVPSFALGLLAVSPLVYALPSLLVAVRRPRLALPIGALGLAVATFSIGLIETRASQAVLPDLCFLHSVWGLGASVIRAEHRTGTSFRDPAPLSAIERRGGVDVVVLIISESVRADALASEPGTGKASFLDRELPARIGFPRATMQASGTFSSLLTLWTGLAPNATLSEAHRAPLLWEVARAAGYRTAYVTSQNCRFRNLGVYTTRAGIDARWCAEDLEASAPADLGARDELALDRALSWLKETRSPRFAVLHLANTHYPYRIDPALTPNQPMSTSTVPEQNQQLFNRYRNAVLLQERSLADFFRRFEAEFGAERRVVLLVSDHGEQFREHGGVTHLRSVYDEELRVPAFLQASSGALTDEQRQTVGAQRQRRIFAADFHATMLDLLGAFDARASLPYGDRQIGRSLLRPFGASEPVFLLSNTSALFWMDQQAFGVMQGESKLVGSPSRPWVCFDTRSDPSEKSPRPANECASLVGIGARAFPEVPSR